MEGNTVRDPGFRGLNPKVRVLSLTVAPTFSARVPQSCWSNLGGLWWWQEQVQVGNSGVEYPKHHGPESLGWHAAQDIPVRAPPPHLNV